MLLVVICLVSLLVALPGFIHKAGYSIFKGFIPFYNIYLFLTLIEFPPVLLLIFAAGLIFLPDRAFVITLLCILLPFMVSDAYGKGKFTGILTLLFPFIMYPLLGYFTGIYTYDMSEERNRFIKKNKILCFLLVVFSVYMYFNFTMLIDGNKLIDKESMHYVNDIYMSDGRIYNEFLNKKQQKMYKLMLNNTKNFKSSTVIDLNEYGCSDYNECGGLVDVAHNAILVDHPELIPYSGYRWSYSEDEFKLTISFAKSNPLAVEFGEIRINNIIDDIKKDTEDMSDIEKVRYVYEWIGDNNTYDKTFTYTSKNQSIYNVFMKKNAVCAGFAKASQVIFQNLGINSYIVYGETSGPHMWNIVELDGKYYYYDSTVAASIRDKDSSWYYNGLMQSEMSDYIASNSSWYPEISNDNGLFDEKK